MSDRFGEIRIVYEENPVGIILREDKNGVVLEEFFDGQGQNVDVIHQFDEGITLLNPQCFKECIEVARRYEPDFNVPIFIKKIVKNDKEDTKKKDEKKAYFMSMVDKSLRFPWDYFGKPTT